MIIAGVGFIPKVSGTMIAIVAEGPSPGRMPTIVPRKAPSAAIARLFSVRQVANPPIRLCMTSIFSRLPCQMPTKPLGKPMDNV